MRKLSGRIGRVDSPMNGAPAGRVSVVIFRPLAQEALHERKTSGGDLLSRHPEPSEERARALLGSFMIGMIKDRNITGQIFQHQFINRFLKLFTGES